MAQKFSLELNTNDWATLDKKAKEMGFPGSREYINHLIISLAEKEILKKQCPGDRRKWKNNYDIPKELEEFYSNLCCRYSSNPSKIFLRFVIMPQLTSELFMNQDDKGA